MPASCRCRPMSERPWLAILLRAACAMRDREPVRLRARPAPGNLGVWDPGRRPRACARAGMPRIGAHRCATPWPATCCRPGRRWPRSVRCCAIAASCRQRPTPRLIVTGSGRWQGRGREVWHDRSAAGRRGLPGDAPGAGVRAGPRGPDVDELYQRPGTGRAASITTELAVAWAGRTRPGVNPACCNRRLTVVPSSPGICAPSTRPPRTRRPSDDLPLPAGHPPPLHP